MSTQSKPVPTDRGSISVSELPVIMCGIGRRPRQKPLSLVSSLSPAGVGEVLFYPGCGADLSPLTHFAQKTALKAVVYVDYLIRVPAVKAMVHKACQQLGWSAPGGFQGLKASDFGVRAWSDFWHESDRSMVFADPANATGFQCDIPCPSGSIRFVFLRTEGHQTYENLLRTPLQPDIVVLQDHGFGGNWQPFGGVSDMFCAAESFDCFPSKLFVAEGTQPWPRYNRTESSVYLNRQMHEYVHVRINSKAQVRL